MEWHCSDQHTIYLNSTPTENKHTLILLTVAPLFVFLIFWLFHQLQLAEHSFLLLLSFPEQAVVEYTFGPPACTFIPERSHLSDSYWTEPTQELKMPKNTYPTSHACVVPPARVRRGPRNPSRRLLIALTVDRWRVLQWPLPVRHWGALPVFSDATGWGGARPAGAPATHARHLLP